MKLAIRDYFFNETHKAKINAVAEKYGVIVDYFGDDPIPADKLGDYEILYGRPTADELRGMTKLKWLATTIAGVEVYCKKDIYCNDVVLTNSSGAYGLTISEHLIMVTLMLLRKMPFYSKAVSDHSWVKRSEVPSIGSIYGSRITVMGTGDIGTNYARRVKAMGASVVHGVRRTVKAADPAFDDIYTFDNVADILPQTDILVLALPGTKETVGIVTKELIAKLPKSAYIINIGRGALIDQDALIEALNNEQIAGAALDVMVPEPLPKDHPLWNAKNVLITPHCSGNMSLWYTQDKTVEMFCENLDLYMSGKPLKHIVDMNNGY